MIQNDKSVAADSASAAISSQGQESMDANPRAQAVFYAFRFGRTLVEFRHYAEFLWCEASEDDALPDGLDTIVGELIDLADRLVEGDAVSKAGQRFAEAMTAAWQRFQRDWQSPLHRNVIRRLKNHEPEDWLVGRRESLLGSPLMSDELTEVDRKAQAMVDELSPLVRACFMASRTITIGSHVTVSDPKQSMRFEVSERRYITVELNRELQVALADLWQCLPRSVELDHDLSGLDVFEAIARLESFARQLQSSVVAVLKAELIETSHECPPTALVQPEAAVDLETLVIALGVKFEDLRPRHFAAFLGYQSASKALSKSQAKRVTDNDAHEWLKQQGRPVVDCARTFSKYVRTVRKAFGIQKYKSRVSLESRSAVRIDEAERQEPLDRVRRLSTREDKFDRLGTLLGDIWGVQPDVEHQEKAKALLTEFGATPEQIVAIVDRKDDKVLTEFYTHRR